MTYEAAVLQEPTRAALAARFKPVYPDFVAHHVTMRYGVPKDPNAKYGSIIRGFVVGYAADDGVEALVVSIDGTSTRPDGKTYHITWSLDKAKGKKPVMSNNLIERGWERLPKPIPFTAVFEYI